ncbi:MAG: hypothetical protein R3C03_11480 [Pirellulaceae bacterium]
MLKTWLVLIAIGVLGATGDAWAFQWARTDRCVWIVAACVVHVASVVLFGWMLGWDRHQFCSVFMISSLVHAGVVVAADVSLFSATLSGREWLGVALAVVAVVLLESGRDEREKSDHAIAVRSEEAMEMIHGDID